MFSFITLSFHCMYAHTHTHKNQVSNSYFTISNLFLLLYSYRITESKPYQLGGLPSIQFSHSVASDSLWPCGLQHARFPCPSPTPRARSNSCPSSQWCHPTILILCHPLLLLHSIFPSNRVFSKESVLHIRWPNHWSFSFSISPSKEYSGLISLRLTGLILQSKGLSRVFSNTTVQKHQFFGTQLSLWVQISHPYMTTGKPIALTRQTFVSKVMSLAF